MTNTKQLPPEQRPPTILTNPKQPTNNKQATQTGTPFAQQEANNKNQYPDKNNQAFKRAIKHRINQQIQTKGFHPL